MITTQKTLLIGNFGAQNVGDELILKSALQDYPEAIVMTVDPEYSQKFCTQKFPTTEFFPTGIKTWVKFLFSRAYRDQVLDIKTKGITRIVFPGGGLFAIRLWAFLIWGVVVWWCRRLLPGVPISFEHQGVDQDLNWIQQKIVRWSFSQAAKISVRDEVSQAVLKNLNMKSELVLDRVEGYLPKSKKEKKEKICLINARSNFLFNKDKSCFPDYQKVFVAFAPTDLDFVPVGFEGEVVFPKTAEEVLDLFARAEVVIGERLHCLILGNHFCGAAKTFLLREPYAEKVASFCTKNSIEVKK
jgi:polysaccharide pyruvyl transferase WcaK-like protein